MLMFGEEAATFHMLHNMFYTYGFHSLACNAGEANMSIVDGQASRSLCGILASSNCLNYYGIRVALHRIAQTSPKDSIFHHGTREKADCTFASEHPLTRVVRGMY